MLTSAPRGTKDILPEESGAWRYLEEVLRQAAQAYGYQELRTPTFEHTELFQRGIGDATDVVEKEMYTFEDRGRRSLTLRPENTASAVRAYVEHKLYGQGWPARLYYLGSMFRYDRPQAGRYREFHQFGCEVLGSGGPEVDAELILLALQVLRELGLQQLELKLNSVGCPQCRPRLRQKLRAFYAPKLEGLCQDCRSRYERNPLRLLDCKVCAPYREGAPNMLDCLCPECRQHFARVQELLQAASVSFTLDPTLVRGLDYYTKTAFEIQYPPLGAQSAVAGGGRYDGLVEELGGPATPGSGFAMGLERLYLAMAGQGLLPPPQPLYQVYAVAQGQQYNQAFQAVTALRAAHIRTGLGEAGRSLKAQLKAAHRAGAGLVLIFGEEEAQRGQVVLRDMAASSQREIAVTAITSILQSILQAEVGQDD